MIAVAHGEEAYLGEVEAQAEWHSAQSRRARRAYFALRLASTVGGAGMALVASTAHLAPWAGAVGFAVAVAGGLLDLGQYRDRWTEYRRTAERLRSELRRYRARARPYAGEGAFLELVDRVEETLAEGLGAWSTRASGVDKQGSK